MGDCTSGQNLFLQWDEEFSIFRCWRISSDRHSHVSLEKRYHWINNRNITDNTPVPILRSVGFISCPKHPNSITTETELCENFTLKTMSEIFVHRSSGGGEHEYKGQPIIMFISPFLEVYYTASCIQDIIYIMCYILLFENNKVVWEVSDIWLEAVFSVEVRRRTGGEV